MNRIKHTVTALLGIVLLVGVAQAQDKELNLEKARESIATLEAVPPQQPRKVLIFSGVGAFRHNAIEFGKQVLPLLGEMTGAYEAVVTDDAAYFEKDSLSQFDAVIFNNTSGRAFHNLPWKEARQLPDEERNALFDLEDRAQKNLMEFIRNGGGFVGIHAATDTYTRGWDEYTEMIGGKFEGHPWNKRTNVVVDIVEPEHPLVAGIFEENSFPMQEEIYIMKDVNDEWIGAHDRRMLLKLNIEESQKRPMPEGLVIVPISWIKEIGEGRLFYTSLGHNAATFENPGTLELYLRGIQYACGDIPADASFAAKGK